MPSLNPLVKSCVALAVSQLLTLPTVAHAATITVNSVADNDVGCSLREAIVSANTSVNQNNGCATGSDAGTDVITFASNINDNTITLSNGELSIATGKNIDIDASNISGGITIDANRGSRILNLESATLSMQNLRLTGGLVASEIVGGGGSYSNYGGSAIYANNSNLTLNNSTVSGNSGALLGGAILAVRRDENLSSQIILNDSIVSNNTASYSGGGVFSANVDVELNNSRLIENMVLGSVLSGDPGDEDVGGRGGAISINGGATISLNGSTLAGNSALDGGGLHAYTAQTVAINNSTISGNTALVEAGGIQLFGTISQNATLTITNSTISGNSAFNGGGIVTTGVEESTLNNTTISNNSATNVAGLAHEVGTLTLNNSIIANSVGLDCNTNDNSATLILDSASIIEDSTCGANRSGDPGLLPLADNGGPTQTHALAPTSIAINSGASASCLSTDQRGEQRDSPCDVGAFELPGSNTNTFVIPLPNGRAVIFDL